MWTLNVKVQDLVLPRRAENAQATTYAYTSTRARECCTRTGPDGAACSACVAGKYKATNGSGIDSRTRMSLPFVHQQSCPAQTDSHTFGRFNVFRFCFFQPLARNVLPDLLAGSLRPRRRNNVLHVCRTHSLLKAVTSTPIAVATLVIRVRTVGTA